jgi:hypothetical protein
VNPISDTFPIGETLDTGAYEIIETLFGQGDDRVLVGAHPDGSADRFLVSMTDRRTPPIPQLRTCLDPDHAGYFPLVYIGSLDERGETQSLRWLRTEQTAVIEKLPPGQCLRRLLTGPLPTRQSIRLALDTAHILVQALRAGCILEGIRPETIWAEAAPQGLRVTGLSRRGPQLFQTARHGDFVTPPPYEYAYLAPEDVAGKPQTDRTLTFILAVLLVEWLTGSHPFPKARYAHDALSIATGRYTEFVLPRAVDGLLRRSLHVVPERRPAFEELVQELTATIGV